MDNSSCASNLTRGSNLHERVISSKHAKTRASRQRNFPNCEQGAFLSKEFTSHQHLTSLPLPPAFFPFREVCDTARRFPSATPTTTMHGSSIRSALASAFQIPLRPAAQSTVLRAIQPARLVSLGSSSTNGLIKASATFAMPKPLTASLPSFRSSFSTTAARAAKKGRGHQKKDHRISEWPNLFGELKS